MLRDQGAISPDAAVQHAAALYQAGRLDEARRLALEVIAARPDHFNAYHLLGAIAVRANRPEECVAHATRALELAPGHPEALCNRGIALRALDRIDAALADYDKVLAARPDFVPALNLKGVALAALNRHEEAIALYSSAIALDPKFAPARFNRGLSHLVRGELEPGWRDQEWRWGGSDTQMPQRTFAQPQWLGEDLRGKTIFVHAEQGMGDAIQFCRYVPLLAARGASVVLEVHPPLEPLFAALEGASRVIALGEAPPAFDYHSPILSLPLAFGTRLDSIPAGIAYVRAAQPHLARWQEQLGPRTGLRVGIAWSGSTTLRNDRNRSIALESMLALRDPAWTLVSLQKEVRERDRPAVERASGILRFEGGLADFRDTAALIAQLDVVVSVDTAVAHLAGAMGKPVWILLPYSPDWRWMLGREDSPWYPTARLFRQPARGDWRSPIERVAGALRALPR